MCATMFFDANFKPRANFSSGCIAETCQKTGFLKNCRLFQRFLSSCTQYKNKLGFVMPLGYLEKQLTVFKDKLGRGKLVWPI